MAKRVNKRVLIILTVIVAVAGVGLMGASLIGRKFFKKNAQELVAESERQEKLGDVDEAVLQLRAACAASPRDPALPVMLGDLYSRHVASDVQNVGKARAAWESALVVDDKYKPALERLLDMQWAFLQVSARSDTFTAIRQAAQRLLVVEPENVKAKARLHMATIRAAQAGVPSRAADIEASVKALRELSRANPADPEPPFWAGQGDAYLVFDAARRVTDMDDARAIVDRLEPTIGEMLKGQDANAPMQLRAAQLYLLVAQLDAMTKRTPTTAPSESEAPAAPAPKAPTTSPATTRPTIPPAVAPYADRVSAALAAARQYSKPSDPDFVDIQIGSAEWFRMIGKAEESRKVIDDLIAKKGDDPAVRLAVTRTTRQDPTRRQQVMELLARPVAMEGLTGVDALIRKDRADQVRFELATLRLSNIDAEKDPAKRKAIIEQVQADLKFFEAQSGGAPAPAVLDLKGRLLLVQNRIPEGITYLQQAVDRSGDGANVESMLTLARAYVMTNQTGQAEKLYRQVVTRHPDYTLGRAQWIEVLVRDGNMDEAREQLAEFKKRAPNAPEIPPLEAVVEGGKKRDEFIGQMPETTPEERIRKATALRADGKTDEALEMAESIFKQDPKNLQAVQMLLELHMSDNRRDEALAVAQAAIRANPDNKQLAQIPERLSKRTPEEFEQWVLEQVKQEPDAFARELKLHEYHLQKFVAATQAKKDEDGKRHAAQAEAHLVNAEKLKPDEKVLAHRRFEFLVQQKRFDEAGAMLQQLAASNADQVNGQLFRYRLAIAKGDLGAAEAAARDLTRTRGEFAQGWQFLGAVMAAQGRLREAVGAYTTALERQGRNYDALKGLIDTHNALGDTAEAKAWLDRARQIYPDDVTLREAGLNYELTYGDPAKVVAERERLFKENPEAPFNALALADAYRRNQGTAATPALSEDLLSKARKTLEDGMKKWPDDDRFEIPLAQVMLAQGDFIGGENLLKKRTERADVKDTPGAAEMLLGDYYISAQKPALAEESYREAVKKSGGAAAFKQQLAQLYAQMRRYDEAVKELDGVPGPAAARQRIQYLGAAGKTAEMDQAIRDAVAANPASAELSNLQLDLFINGGRFDDAKNIIQQRLAKNDADEDARYYSAMLKLRTGNASEAAKELSEISSRIPKSVGVLTLLADAHYASGDVASAVEDLDRALQLSPTSRDVRVKLIDWLGSQRRWDAISKLAVEALKNPRIANDPAWPRALAKAQANTGRFADAEKSITRAIELMGPERAAELQREYLGILLQARNYAKVLKLTDEWLAKGRKDWWIYQHRGLAKAGAKDKTSLQEFDTALAGIDRAKQFREAEAIIRTVASSAGTEEALKRIAPWEAEEPRWRILAAELLSGKLDFAGALSHLQPLEADADKLPTDIRAAFYLNVGQAYHQAQPRPELAKAVSWYEKYIQLRPTDVLALNNLAYVLAEQITPPRVADAKVYSQKAYAIVRDWKASEDKSRILDTHGWILVLNEGREIDEGIKILQECVDESPILEAHYHLGEAQLRKKRGEEAAEQLKAALAMIDKAKKDKTPYDETLEPRIQRALERAEALNAAAQAR